MEYSDKAALWIATSSAAVETDHYSIASRLNCHG